ncbi:MAG: hypothetical protein NC399_08145 [Muribaculum sp.]|nr:hypothetical protein [Muribaculum sp.]
MKKGRPGNHSYKRIWVAAFAICVALATAGCAAEGDFLREDAAPSLNAGQRKLYLEEMERREKGSQSSAGEDVSAAQTPWELPENGSFLEEDGSAYAYAALSESEQIWYRDMAQAMGTMTDRVKLSAEGFQAGLNESVVDHIFQCVLSDHPELFYVEGYSYTKYTRGDKTVAIEFTGTYGHDWDTVLARRREIEKAVCALLAEAPKTQDDYEKIKYVYEALVLNTEYDLNADENQNIYSVFVGHASVCQGYAKAFQYLMNRMGVECALVQGKVRDTGEGHAWNLVRSNGEFYYVDATWGDISYQNTESSAGEENLPRISYDYLCITTELLERTHLLAENDGMPECTAVSDNYFVREDALFERYDKEQLAALLERRLAEGGVDISLRCADRICYRTMCEALLDRQEIFDYLEGTGINSFVYTDNDRQLTLTFFMVTSKG